MFEQSSKTKNSNVDDVTLNIIVSTDQSLGCHLERIVGILCDCVPKKQDPFVSLKCLMKLNHLLKQEEHPLNSNGELERFLPVIVSGRCQSYKIHSISL